MKKILIRLLLALAIGALLLWPAYLVIANHWIRQGGLEERLNRRPERLWFQWDSAWTPWPGVVRVTGFQMRNQTTTFQWWLAVDQGTLDIDLWKLRDRELLLGPIQGRGAAFRLRRRLDAPPRSRQGNPDLYPPIPGFTNPPAPKPEEIYPRGPRREPWHIRITGVDLDDVREIWVEEVRFAGDARVAGGFDMRARQRVEVMPTRMDIRSGSLALGAGKEARPIVADARGRLDGRIEPWSPRLLKGMEVFQVTSGRLTLEGRVRDLDFLDVFFRETRWVDLELGGGKVAADLRLRRGRALPGSRLEATPERISVAFLDYRARGDGGVRWWVEEPARKGDEPEGRLSLNLDSFRLHREGFGKAHVSGRDLHIEAASDEPRFGGLFKPRRVAIDMPHAEVPDLRFYNAYLPQSSGLALTSGSGRMSAHFRAAAPEWIGSGEMRLSARRLGARFEDRTLRGDLEMHTLLRRAALLDKTFDISGTKLDLTDVVLTDGAAQGEPGQAPELPVRWWARAHLDRAILAPGAPVFLRARLESTLSDPRPLFALVAPSARGRMLRWVDNLLDIQGVGAVADIELGRSFVDVDQLAVVGGDAQIQGRFRVAEGDRRGVLYASLGRFDVGMELAAGKRDWKILRPKKWFENYPPFE
jgi:hypothetical protein